MATWTRTAQLTSGTLTIGATDRLWFNATNFGDNIPVNSYQDSTHVTNASDVHQCTTNHVHNTKYLDATHLSLDGAASSLLSALATTNAPLKWNFSDASSVAMGTILAWAYGANTATAPSGVTVQMAEVGVSTSWKDVGGSANALSLADQSAATSHDFFLAISVVPTSNGAKSWTFEISGNYI